MIVIRTLPASRFRPETSSSASDPAVTAKVRTILSDVRKRGDVAVRAWTRKLDGVKLTNLRVDLTKSKSAARPSSSGKSSIGEKKRVAEKRLVADMKLAWRRILACHRAFADEGKLVSDGEGGTWGRIVRPLKRVGVYVPGGSAPLFSTLLMAAAAARAAGVREIVVCTPPPVHPAIRLAAAVAGVTELYAVGGAQAIGALAFGTASIPAVEKIVGPGNRFVAEAKRQVFGTVGIDSVAGPSEILILADDSARASVLAADLLAQAEHDVFARAFLATTSLTLAADVSIELQKQLATLPRRAIAGKSLDERGAIVLCKDRDEMLTIADRIAAEHIELQVRDPWQWVPLITAAGSIFVGADAPEILGDYVAGPNHILPTGGTARFSPPLSSRDFVSVSSVQSFTPAAAARLAPVAARLARAEGLEGHARSIESRGYAKRRR